ncbi:MAG: hypothetical protein KDI51_21440, partial [Xanthomonadales bacterium]|nr:hypothetical protein [Xanthomonadales bacterium]
MLAIFGLFNQLPSQKIASKLAPTNNPWLTSLPYPIRPSLEHRIHQQRDCRHAARSSDLDTQRNAQCASTPATTSGASMGI